MPRVRPDDRFDCLVRAATEVFIRAGGFHRTQIRDVARAMGVAKGTVYLYVESKEALFDLVLRHADSDKLIAPPAQLPVATPAPGATVAEIERRLSREGQLPLLAAAIASPADDVATEVADIVTELYDVLRRHRRTIKLLAVAAPEIPQLAAVWIERGRQHLIDRLDAYLSSREQLSAIPDPAVAARLIVETVSWFAIHRHWESAPQPMDESSTRHTVVAMLTRSLVGDRA